MIGEAFRTIRADLGVSVRYVRGGVEVELDAVRGRSVFETLGGFGDVPSPIDTIATRDFLFDAAEFRARFGEPVPGDLIIETLAGETVANAVAPISGSRCFDYSDTAREVLRVHTKEHDAARPF